MPKKPNESLESYLGLLYPTEDFRVYGSVTLCEPKRVTVMESQVHQQHEHQIRFGLR